MAKDKIFYPNIDMKCTGLHLKNLIEAAGYTVREIQEYLHLSCPQPIYRWFKGQILPSVDHLLMLSRLLHMHMEELLIMQGSFDFSMRKRLLVYYSKLCIQAA